MPLMRGTITLVQESRFQLTDEQGASHLFLLDRYASTEPDQLPPLAARQARIRVRFKESRNLIAAVAQAIFVDDVAPEMSS